MGVHARQLRLQPVESTASGAEVRDGGAVLPEITAPAEQSSLQSSLREETDERKKTVRFVQTKTQGVYAKRSGANHEPRIESRPAELKTNSGSLIGQRRLSVGPSGPKRRTRFLPKCRTQICNYCPRFLRRYQTGDPPAWLTTENEQTIRIEVNLSGFKASGFDMF